MAASRGPLPGRQAGERVDAQRRRGGQHRLERAEQRRRRARAAHEWLHRRGADREAEQVDREDRGERVDDAAEGHGEQPRPRHLVEDRRQPRERDRGQQSARERGDRVRCGPRRRRARAGAGAGRARAWLSAGGVHRARRDGRGRAGSSEEDGGEDREVEEPGPGGGARQPEPGDQDEPGGQRPRDRAEGVDRVQARHRPRRGDGAPARRVLHHHRQRGPHGHGRHQQRREQQQEAHAVEQRPGAAERVVEPGEQRSSRLGGERREQGEDADHALEHGVAEQRIAQDRRAAPRERGSQAQPAEERGDRGGDAVHRVAEQQREELGPHHLERQPGRAREEEAGRDQEAGGIGCARGPVHGSGGARCGHGPAKGFVRCPPLRAPIDRRS